MENRFIPQMEPWFGEEEREALNNYMQSDGWITEFMQTRKFEEMIAEFTGVKHCIAVNNGTISLTIGAIACGLKAGDEVIVPNYTMIATPNSMKLFGAKPVFVDVEPSTLCIDIQQVKDAINSRTRAVIFVAANGRYPSYDIKELKKLCDDNKLILIEDAAQALGSYYPDGRHIGTVSNFGSISFSAPKIISTGQGGAIITNNDELANRVRKLKDFGRESGGNDKHDIIGWNFKFTDLQAVIGIEQMKKLPERILKKKEIFSLYKDKLENFHGIKLFNHDLNFTTPWFIDSMVERRNELENYLRTNKIGSRLMYPPINKQKAYDHPGEYKESNLVGEKGLWLPSASQLSMDEINKICNKIKDFYI
jgi:perosamine synthetase